MSRPEIDLLKKLVAIRSIFPEEKKLALFLEKYLKKIGFRTKRQVVEKNRFNLLAEKGRGNRALLFYGHLDTVGLSDGWKTNPFNLQQKGDKFLGLGARDMKSGLVAILKAIENVAVGQYKLKIAFCVDEENISKGAYELVGSSWLNDIKLVISADSGDIFGKNRLPFRYILGRRGRCVVCVEIPGKSVHGAFAQKGINAIDEASKFILNLKKIRQIKHKKLKRSSFFIRKIKCQATGLTLPALAFFEIDKQLIPPENPKSFVEAMRVFGESLYHKEILNPDLKKQFKVYLKPRETEYIKPFVQSLGNKYIKMIDKIIFKTYGFVDYSYGLSVADDNIFYHYLKAPVVCLGIKGGNPHEANEWVSLEGIKELIKIYRLILKEIPRIL